MREYLKKSVLDRGKGLKTVCPHPDDPVPTFNWVFENSICNINTAKSLQKGRKPFLAD